MIHLKPHLDPLCWHFADLVANHLAHHYTKVLFLGALVASLATEEQHACAYLPHYSGKPVTENSPDTPVDQLLGIPAEPRVFYPEAEAWKRGLRKHPDVVGVPGEYKPLILDGDRLYLYRYWDYETRLATAIQQRLSQPEVSESPYTTPVDTKPSADFQALVKAVFEEGIQNNTLDWQAIAATTALGHRFHVISGGPGTGKTTTVSRLVALLLYRSPDLRMVLAAPTGKAATRMKESLSQSRTQLPMLPSALLAQFPTEALTLHRLLGYQVKTGTYRHHKDNPLPWDMVIVDEASMIDLAMMTRLLEALSPTARLVLLGDQYQLASVEAGSVLGDICKATTNKAFSAAQQQQLHELGILPSLAEHKLAEYRISLAQHAIDGHVVMLEESRRFDPHKGIGKLAHCVQHGNTEHLGACLNTSEIHHQSHWSPQDLQQLLLKHYGAYFASTTAREAWDALNAMMILCAVKRGPRGVLAMNQQVEQVLRSANQLRGGTQTGAFYHLRPVMITQNDYRNQLFNGDIGVTWQPETEKGKSLVYFQQTDGSFKPFHSAQLGPHQTAWAMTIHKSQGSEFKHVLLVLPETPHKLVSRELIYTGITRARESVNLWCDLDVLEAGVKHQVERYSGLVEALQSEINQAHERGTYA